jgi:cytochrome c oxidase subunit 2
LAVLSVASTLLAGCNSNQSITNPETSQAREIDTLWWAMFAGAMVVFAAVLGLLVLAFVRRRRAGGISHDDRGPYMVVVGGGFVAPVVLLAILFGFVIHVMPAVSTPPPGSARMTVDVIGHQWYWEVRYPGASAVTANEIHLPASTPVAVSVRSADVIHSFWVPRLNRKIDMIPGRTNHILLDVPDPGVYRGQCSEFCGPGHALMAFDVIVQPRAAFRAWLARQQQPAATASGGQASAGMQVFLSQGCADCHTIQGTSAAGTAGPDLTHLGGRGTLAALTLPNTPADLFDWITNPQRYKPGARMPGFASLPAEQRHALVDYLESLR